MYEEEIPFFEWNDYYEHKNSFDRTLQDIQNLPEASFSEGMPLDEFFYKDML